MVYDASIRRRSGPRLTDRQAKDLERLEKVQRPTDFQRGQLDALRMSTPIHAERARTEALKSKWAKPPTDNAEGGQR